MLFLMGSQVLLMEAPAYWVMCLARIIQGVSSSVVWVAGLALLCETVPEAHVGRQLGLAMTGLSLGVLVGPPVGGALYHTFGYRGPFIFGIIVSVIDLIGRLLIIERKDALLWGIDPASLPEPDQEQNAQPDNTDVREPQETKENITGHMGGPQDVQTTPATSDVQRMDRPIEYKGDPVDAPALAAKNLSEAVAPINPAEAHEAGKKYINAVAVLVRLSKSPRALSAFFVTIAYGIVYASQEPTIPLHMQAQYGYDSARVGLVFIASVVPNLISSPLAGWLADTRGAEWVVTIMLLASIPWWLILAINGPVALFIASFALESLFASGALSPITAELASVARTFDDIGYAHVYGAFNIAYGIGSAIGPLIGGQIYDHTKRGWLAVCALDAGLIFLSGILSFYYTGETSLLKRTVSLLRTRNRPTRAP
ncbi:MFS general substrate transporter [Gloeophyllum trabeum ATCC 11539]|uniref:MFS general substrate transporter n=1 Tax=Gloeophyllum trabeum (strain ATCC 11539 / FP-39264 / Madison 617) TaxID=670483 RepID=S7QNF4_GLOTA|nr:MFS general substrate transporter [Gloeophyllum trabeum ATCC 11539]EPQ61048.1 MFS general substrate transporter [Gloeophyllum trabeum ATCC 11539]